MSLLIFAQDSRSISCKTLKSVCCRWFHLHWAFMGDQVRCFQVDFNDAFNPHWKNNVPCAKIKVRRIQFVLTLGSSSLNVKLDNVQRELSWVGGQNFLSMQLFKTSCSEHINHDTTVNLKLAKEILCLLLISVPFFKFYYPSDIEILLSCCCCSR